MNENAEVGGVRVGDVGVEVTFIENGGKDGGGERSNGKDGLEDGAGRTGGRELGGRTT